MGFHHTRTSAVWKYIVVLTSCKMDFRGYIFYSLTIMITMTILPLTAQQKLTYRGVFFLTKCPMPYSYIVHAFCILPCKKSFTSFAFFLFLQKRMDSFKYFFLQSNSQENHRYLIHQCLNNSFCNRFGVLIGKSWQNVMQSDT